MGTDPKPEYSEHGVGLLLSLQVAFGADGAPSKALEGFCRKNGITPGDVTREADEKGTEYVWARVHETGRCTADVRRLLSYLQTKYLLLFIVRNRETFCILYGDARQCWVGILRWYTHSMTRLDDAGHMHAASRQRSGHVRGRSRISLWYAASERIWYELTAQLLDSGAGADGAAAERARQRQVPRQHAVAR